MSGKPARYWRADGGYQDAPVPPPPPPYQPIMYCYPGYAPWCYQPNTFLQGPIPLAGLFGGCPPPPYVQSPPLPPPPPAPPKDDTNDEKKKEEKKEKKQEENPWAPPKLEDGESYLFPGNHTMIHVFNKAAPIWNKEKYAKENLQFKIFKVSADFTVKMVIENVLRKGVDDCKGWKLTEAVERGGGEWDKGSTIEYDSDKAKGTLKSMGWSTERGKKLPPTWMVVHQKDFD